jgi:hypothetical protein
MADADETDENLIRRDLTPAQRAKRFSRRRRHTSLSIRRPANPAAGRSSAKNRGNYDNFAKDTAAKSGSRFGP